MKLNRMDLPIMTIKAPSPSFKNGKTKALWLQVVPWTQFPLVNTAININRLDEQVPLCLSETKCLLHSLMQRLSTKFELMLPPLWNIAEEGGQQLKAW